MTSTLTNLTGTALTPFIDEYDTNPLLNSYLALAKSSATSANPMNFLTPEWESAERWELLNRSPTASLNAGELLGLHGWWSILPSILIWLAFSSYLLHLDCQRPPDPTV